MPAPVNFTIWVAVKFAVTTLVKHALCCSTSSAVNAWANALVHSVWHIDIALTAFGAIPVSPSENAIIAVILFISFLLLGSINSEYVSKITEIHDSDR